jgi:purine nucleosidase
VKTSFTKAMLDEIAVSPYPAAKYLAAYTGEFYYLWDELAAAAWLDPKIITKEEKLYIDVDLTRGPFYGDTSPGRPLTNLHSTSSRFTSRLISIL